MGTSADPKPVPSMATPSYAAVAGGRSPPPGKKQSLHQGDEEVNSPRRVFSIKPRADSTATAHPAPKENGSSADIAEPAQHHQKKGSMRLKKQQAPTTSSAPNVSVTENGKPTMPAQQNNNPADSSQKEQSVQPTQPQKEGQKQQQQQKSATMTLTKAEKKKARKMLQQYQQDQIEAGPSSSVRESTAVRDEDKPKANMELIQVQNNPSASAPVNPAPVNPAPVNPAPVNPAPVNPAPVNPAPDVVHSSGYEKSSTQNGTNEENNYLATHSKKAVYWANICGESMDQTIASQQNELRDCHVHLSRQSLEITTLQSKISSLENLLALKGQTQVEEHLRKLEVAELQGKIKQLEAKCSALQDELGHLMPVLNAFRLVEKARGVREAELQAENTRLQNMIKEGVVSISTIWGNEAATAFTNIANGKKNTGENEPTHESPATPSTVPCSPRASKATDFEPAPVEPNASPKSNASSLQKEEAFVQDSRDTSSEKDNENTLSSTSGLVVDKEDSIDHNTSKNAGTPFDSAKFEARGTGSWADEVEEEELQKGQVQPPQDVARVDEKSQPEPLSETPQGPRRKFQSTFHPRRGGRPYTGFQARSGDGVSSSQSIPPTANSSDATPGGSKPPEENKKMTYREQKTGNQSVASGREDYAQKIHDLYAPRKRTKPYHHNNKSINNDNYRNTPRGGNTHRDDGASENKTEGEDEGGWTSVKGKGKASYQAKHMGSWRKQ
ncbi:hypothetical protein F5X96DRAFT_53875 [Biscogniauxia mediterranea]|nr:hypothetical protein F5X96DRAFT_53875 [Biscogniauxia mediterranea]